MSSATKRSGMNFVSTKVEIIFLHHTCLTDVWLSLAHTRRYANTHTPNMCMSARTRYLVDNGR